MSLSTLLPTNALHPIIMEITVDKTDRIVEYNNVLHFVVSRQDPWDGAGDAPSYDEFIVAFWDVWYTLLLLQYPSYQEVIQIKTRPVLSAVRVNPKRVDLAYGVSGSKPGDTLFAWFTTVAAEPYSPSYVSIYVKKKVAASPRDILGSFRIGPVPESYTDTALPNRLSPGAIAVLNPEVAAVNVQWFATSATSGNTVKVDLGILQRKDLIGQFDPWNHCPKVQFLSLRPNLGTQNTRKRAKGGY